jgi:hypothetical protein
MRKKQAHCDKCESSLCFTCNGSGEGMHNGAICRECEGQGTLYSLCDACAERAWREEDEAWERAKERYYNAKYGRGE